MKCLVLKHVAFEDLGLFAEVLIARGISIEYRQAGINPISMDEWRTTPLIIVLGGPIGVYEIDTYPWLTEEIEGIRQRLKLQLPTLGICLGAQLMASALGASVYPGTAKEIGWANITLTDAGALSSLASLANVPVLHWHGDTFDLPNDATLLASTSLTKNQAYSVGNYALGLQFHPEVNPAYIETWLIGHACELSQARIDIKALRQRSAELSVQVCQAGNAMLEQWLTKI